MNLFQPRLRGLALGVAAVAVSLSGVAQAGPATSKALALMPKEAQVALALPPIQESLQAYVDFAKKVTPEADIEAELKKFIADLAADAKAEGAESLQDIFLARGLDPAQPVAAFVDFSRSLKDVADAQKGGDEDSEEDKKENKKAAPKPGDPAWALVAGVVDEDKVALLLKDIAESAPDLDPATAQEVEAGGQKVTVVSDYAHFIADGRLVLGSKELVLATATQWGEERSVRYGTSEVPAGENEIVALVYGDRLFPLLDQLLPALEMDATSRAIAVAQVAALKSALQSEGGEDPIYITHSVSGNRSDLSIRLDNNTHPGYLKLKGQAHPLRLAQLLPESTLAMLSLRFNEEAKKQLAEQILPAIQESGQEAAVFAVPAIQMIGDEITIGIAAVENDFPAAYIMIALAEPDAAKGMLNMLVPAMPAETYKDVEIKAIAAPIPVPVQMATPGDMVVLSNNVDGLKQIIDLKLANGKTDMLQKLKDPLDPTVPRYQALIFKSQLITDVVLPLSALAGGLPGDVGPAVTQGSAAVEEIRYVSEIRDNWSVAQFTLYLK